VGSALGAEYIWFCFVHCNLDLSNPAEYALGHVLLCNIILDDAQASADLLQSNQRSETVLIFQPRIFKFPLPAELFRPLFRVYALAEGQCASPQLRENAMPLAKKKEKNAQKVESAILEDRRTVLI